VNTAELSVAKKLSVYGTTEPRYCFTSSGCSRTASENEQKMIPSFASLARNVCRHRHRVEDRVHGDAGEQLLLDERNAELVERRADLGSTSSMLPSDFFCFGAA
jgi:hypothetical protein